MKRQLGSSPSAPPEDAGHHLASAEGTDRQTLGAEHAARLSVKGISKSFLATQALRDVEFEVEAGQGHAIVGQNGAGKSTLVRILAGALQPDVGEIRLDGEPVRFQRPYDAQQAGVFTIYQELSLVPALSVAENILLGDLPRTPFGAIHWPRARREAQADLEQLGFRMDVTSKVQSLPLAYRQAVEIAKGVRRRARVILLDEPTASLAKADAERLFDVLRGLQRRGLAVVYISHRLDELSELCQQVTVLRDGAHAGTFSLAEATPERIIDSMLGQDGRRSYAESGASENTPTQLTGGDAPDEALGIAHLSDGQSFRDVTLSLRKGEVLGVTGLAGSGQAELGLCLFGARRIASGEVRVDGKSVALGSPRDAIAAGIALVPEERKSQGLVLGMSVLENMTMASLKRLTRHTLVRRNAARAEAERLHNRLGVTGMLEQPVGTLSGGNQQKVVFAKWLLTGARVLILAEPTRGIDVHAKAEIWRIIRELTREGASVLVISSDEEEAVMCDRVVVMARGAIVGETVPAQVQAPHDAVLEMAWGGGSQVTADTDPAEAHHVEAGGSDD